MALTKLCAAMLSCVASTAEASAGALENKIVTPAGALALVLDQAKYGCKEPKVVITASVTGTDWTTSYAHCVYWRTRDGEHWLKFQISGALGTTATSGSVSIGLSISAARTFPVLAINGADTWCRAYMTGADVNFSAGATSTDWFLVGEVELSAAPSFATAPAAG